MAMLLERKLKALVEKFPDVADKAPMAADCPTKRPGSSLIEDYPRRIEQLAESLLAYHKLRSGADV